MERVLVMFSFASFIVSTGVILGLSEGAGATEASPTPLPSVTVKESKTKSPLIQKRGKRREQKETEGTEAPERFEADPILKSPYSIDGQPLEVDPD